MTEHEFLITEEAKDMRIDKALTILFPNRSRSYFQKLISEGNVSLNGKTVKAKDLTTVGDSVVLHEPDPEVLSVEAEDIPLDIIYEDDDILIVNKPKNMVVHPAPGHPDHTLVNAVMYHCKDSLSSINGVLRPGIVHRIDQDTTGSLIICKNDNAHQKIAEQLAVHSINRRYLGIVHGVLKNDSGTINAPIGRNPNDRKKMAINERNGKPAVTHYKVLKRFHNYTYCEFKLDTGRTHQIRVHMASIGHPLLGDPLYGPRKCPIPHLVGQTLHAWKIGFIHPTTRQYVEFEAPIPEYFQKLLKRTDL